jgi:hypothetical protein
VNTEKLIDSFLALALKRIESLEADVAKNDERIAFLENELEARIKLAEQFYTAKS